MSIDRERRPPARRGAAEGTPPARAPASSPVPSSNESLREHLLERAARRVAAEEAHGDAARDLMAEEELRLLASDAARDQASGPPPADEGLPGPRVVQRRRLLDLLAAEVVRLWAEAPENLPADQVLAALASVQTLRERLEPEGSGRFASRLAEPDGLELIVEMAHDLRSPLTSILFLSETLRSGHSGEVNELQQRQLGLIYSAALGLISVASDVMELARGGTRLSEEDPTPFAVSEVLESVREMVQPMAEEKGILLRLLPPEIDHCLGFPVPLSRVLLNLTTNALKFTDEGFVEIVARETSRTRVEFSVRDTGRGIDPEAQRRLFEPFRPGSRPSGHLFSGTGLGLSIARRLVEAMGSTLRFETRAGWGTRFFFELHLPPSTEF